MVRPRFRSPLGLAVALVVVTAAIATAFTTTSKQANEVGELAQRQKECTKQTKEYSQTRHTFHGRVTAIIPHYNESRHECLAEISSERPENGGKVIFDDIFDPNTDRFIGSRQRTLGEQGMHDATI